MSITNMTNIAMASNSLGAIGTYDPCTQGNVMSLPHSGSLLGGVPDYIAQQDSLYRRTMQGTNPNLDTPVEPGEILTVERPMRIKSAPAKADTGLREYATICKELGISCNIDGKLLQEEVADFLWGEGMEMYDLKEVNAYMKMLAQKEKKISFWRPLRSKDVGKVQWGEINQHDHYLNKPGWTYSCNVYDKTIPLEVLKDVKKIVDKFHDTVAFYVSDYAVPHPDPFILVTAPGMDRIVFGVWDEPGFFKNKA